MALWHLLKDIRSECIVLLSDEFNADFEGRSGIGFELGGKLLEFSAVDYEKLDSLLARPDLLSHVKISQEL